MNRGIHGGGAVWMWRCQVAGAEPRGVGPSYQRSPLIYVPWYMVDGGRGHGDEATVPLSSHVMCHIMLAVVQASERAVVHLSYYESEV